MTPPRIAIVGHGGAGDFYPGNTRRSVQMALDLKVDRIEIDLIATANGELVLVHDDWIENDDGRRVKVRTLPIDRIRDRVDDMLTIDEFFEMIGPSMPVLLDLKKPGYEREVAEAVKRDGRRDVWISTSHAISILRLHSMMPDAKFGLSSGHIATGLSGSIFSPILVRVARALMPLPLLIAAKLCGARMIMANFRACSPWLVRVAHAGGIDVAVWTVNRPRDIQRIAAMGADAIISNRPDLVREIIED